LEVVGDDVAAGLASKPFTVLDLVHLLENEERVPAVD
jgi:hypothetical protein